MRLTLAIYCHSSVKNMQLFSGKKQFGETDKIMKNGTKITRKLNKTSNVQTRQKICFIESRTLEEFSNEYIERPKLTEQKNKTR